MNISSWLKEGHWVECILAPTVKKCSTLRFSDWEYNLHIGPPYDMDTTSLFVSQLYCS